MKQQEREKLEQMASEIDGIKNRLYDFHTTNEWLSVQAIDWCHDAEGLLDSAINRLLKAAEE